jgi:hypothetical protein
MFERVMKQEGSLCIQGSLPQHCHTPVVHEETVNVVLSGVFVCVINPFVEWLGLEPMLLCSPVAQSCEIHKLGYNECIYLTDFLIWNVTHATISKITFAFIFFFTIHFVLSAQFLLAKNCLRNIFYIWDSQSSHPLPWQLLHTFVILSTSFMR